MLDPISSASTSDKDTMYYHEAILQLDCQQFVQAMVKESNEHITKYHWSLIPISKVPANTKIFDSVWSMKSKREIISMNIYKLKARLNFHGGQQQKGINYNETYSPVVGWFSIGLLLVVYFLNNWSIRQVDFVLAFPHTTIDFGLYVKLPLGTVLAEEDADTLVLLLHKNLYRQKKAGRIWNAQLHKGLMDIGFTQSKVDECVYTKEDIIFMVYVDDGITIA